MLAATHNEPFHATPEHSAVTGAKSTFTTLNTELALLDAVQVIPSFEVAIAFFPPPAATQIEPFHATSIAPLTTPTIGRLAILNTELALLDPVQVIPSFEVKIAFFPTPATIRKGATGA